MEFIFELEDGVSFDDCYNELLTEFDASPAHVFGDDGKENISVIIADPTGEQYEQAEEIAERDRYEGWMRREVDLDRPKEWKIHIKRKTNGKVDIEWNHKEVRFPQAIAKAKKQGKLDPERETSATDIKLFQIDTGLSNHNRLQKYNRKDAKSFLTLASDPEDDLRRYGQDSAHGTSTGFTIMGTPGTGKEFDEYDVKPKWVWPNVNMRFSQPLNRGLFPYVNFIPLRVSRSVVLASLQQLIALRNAVNHCIACEADIIAMSMAGTDIRFTDQFDAIATSAAQAGIIFVCSSGSVVDKLVGVMSPANHSLTVGVGGLQTRRSRRNTFETIPLYNGCDGKELDISAPAMWIYTAGKHRKSPRWDYYRLGIGTSQAAAHVAAAAALWKHCWSTQLSVPPFTADRTNIVKAFKWALSRSLRIPAEWKECPEWLERNKGILDVNKLIDMSPTGYIAS